MTATMLSGLGDEIQDARASIGYGGRFYGAYPALVRDIKDPDGQGRVKIGLPWSPDGSGANYEAWARLATMMAGNNRGTWFIPDTGDEVLVVFLGGDPRNPAVVGALWNGQDAPPQSMDGSGQNDVKQICSRNGVKVTLNDKDGQEQLVLETPGGDTLTMKDGPGSVELKDSNGNSMKMESSGITIDTSGTLTVNASTVTMNASSVTVNAGTATFSGTVVAPTVQSSSIVSASYTPGAGNIW